MHKQQQPSVRKSTVKAVKPAFIGKSQVKLNATKLANLKKVAAPKLDKTEKLTPQTGGQLKLGDSDKMDQNLKKKSPWYASLRDPIQGAGAKIPDETGINTAVMQLVQKVSVPVNAQGMAGCEIISPYINLVAGPSASQNFRTTASTSAVGAITWNVAGGFSNSTSMQSVALAHRVVSAAIYGEYEGTSLNDSGDVTSYFLPYAPNAQTVLSAIQANYGSSVIPVNKARSKPAVSRWFPINVNNQSYKDFISPTLSSFGVGASERFCNGLIYSGVSGTGSVIFTMVVNYEFVPSLNTVDFISPTPSPIDPIEEQLVQQWVQEDAQTGLASNKQVDVQPGAQVVEAAAQGMQAESGFGMLGGIISELAPLIIGALI